MNLHEAKLLSSVLAEAVDNLAGATDQALNDIKTQAAQTGLTPEFLEKFADDLFTAITGLIRRNVVPLSERIAKLEAEAVVRKAVHS